MIILQHEVTTAEIPCLVFYGPQCRAFWLFLPDSIKMDSYNFELYRFKDGPFWDMVYIAILRTKRIGVTWPFRVRWRHRSRDHSLARMPFHSAPNTLYLTFYEIFNVECNSVVVLTLIRPLNKGQGVSQRSRTHGVCLVTHRRRASRRLYVVIITPCRRCTCIPTPTSGWRIAFADRSFWCPVRSLGPKWLSQFGPWSLRSLKKGPRWPRTEVTKDRSDHTGPRNSNIWFRIETDLQRQREPHQSTLWVKKTGPHFTAYNFRNMEQIFTKFGTNQSLFILNIVPEFI